MYNFFVCVFIFICIFLVVLIMVQNDQDGDSYSSSISGSRNREITYYSDNTLTKVIGIFAFLFFLISLIICNISYNTIV
ncbi:MAG: preprotein translocase subunit SecG [Buchnera aphidicola (Nurudea shiraii)]